MAVFVFRFSRCNNVKPHPEERRIFAARLEGWQQAERSKMPSFETAAHRNRLLPISTL